MNSDQSSDKNLISKISFFATDTIDQLEVKLSQISKSFTNKIEVESNSDFKGCKIVITPLESEITPNKINAIFNRFTINSVDIGFTTQINGDKFANFALQIETNKLKLENPTAELFFRFYEILYEDIITCNCLRNKIEKTSLYASHQSEYNQPVASKELVISEIKNKGMLVHSDVAGSHIKSPYITQIYKAVEVLFLKTVAKNFEEILIPKVVSVGDFLETGHMRRFGGELFFVSEMKERDSLKLSCALNESVYQRKLSDNLLSILKKPSFCLTYAQCDAFWSFLRNKILISSKLPLCYYDVSGYSYRNEGGASNSIERCNEFKRCELIFVADVIKLNNLYDQLLCRWTAFLESLGFNFNILEVESWSGVWGENISTYDFEVLFQKGKPGLEVGNLNRNSHKYIKKFGIKSNNKSEELISGCSGAGIDRLAFSLLRYYGVDTQNWPTSILEILDLKDLRYDKIFA